MKQSSFKTAMLVALAAILFASCEKPVVAGPPSDTTFDGTMWRTASPTPIKPGGIGPLNIVK